MSGSTEKKSRWFRSKDKGDAPPSEKKKGETPKWSMGVLNDPNTVQVPGSVLLLASNRNEPLGLRNTPARTSHSSIPATGFFEESPTPGGTSGRRRSSHASAPPAEEEEKKMTKDGKIILDPQPESSGNDPLNWPAWRRDIALYSLGFYCMVGGGLTPILAAGFYDVSDEYGVPVEDISLTTALFMMGMGLGSVIASPTAILYGKRPVYLASAVLFVASSIWCALSPNFGSLIAARIFQGIAISPVECLPSATIAEIFFLHERAFRIGIYTLLLLGGKNLVPLISAVIIQSLGWRWVFWIVSFVVALGFVLLFFFVPETFWDRTPHAKPKRTSRRPSFMRRLSSRHDVTRPQTAHAADINGHEDLGPASPMSPTSPTSPSSPAAGRPSRNLHVGWANGSDTEVGASVNTDADISKPDQTENPPADPEAKLNASNTSEAPGASPIDNNRLGTPSSLTQSVGSAGPHNNRRNGSAHGSDRFAPPTSDSEKASIDFSGPPKATAYTHTLRQQPPKSFSQQLKPWNGRLNHDKWFKVMLRPFILFAYPSVLWSTAIYSCSVGWLIVISNTMSMIFRAPDKYNFNAFQTGLIYLSPFVGGILGTAVAGKVSDVVVKALSRRNGGLYEPEFRLVMAAPILVTTVMGLIGFGWSAEEDAHFMVPTVFFGITSFGCSLGSTTAITFCVDSYRQYAGEALVTLNFSKNVLHGLVFSLFVTHWMADDGPKVMYIWLGVIQLILCFCSIPMYIFGKRARMWTIRKNLMEKF